MPCRALPLLFAIGALALTGLSPALGQESLPPPIRQDDALAADTALNICANAAALPYTSEESATPGFQLELHHAIAVALDRRESVTWVHNRRAANRLQCGGWMSRIVAPNMLPTEGQYLTEPYMGTGFVIVRKAGASTRFESLTALLAEPEFRTGGRVGIFLGAWIGGVVERNGVKTAGYIEQQDIIESVLRGEIAAGIVRREDAGWYLRQHPGSLAVIGMYKLDPDFRWDVAMGLRKSNPALLAQINGVLERFRADGTLQAITEKYGFPYLPPYQSH